MESALHRWLEAPDRPMVDRELDTEHVRSQLRRIWQRLEVGEPEEGLFEGQLLRPRFAISVAGRSGINTLGDRIWMAALAVELAHEASLVHDDIVDGARTRRDRETLAASQGVGAALIAGDQLLARAYLSASLTDSLPFVKSFARAVDETIAGERAQGREAGRLLEPDTARHIARRKSGELFGAALSAAAVLSESGEADGLRELGRDLGLLYQRVDDLLDFCPGAGTGKPPLVDLSGGLWTWPRRYIAAESGPEALFLPGEEGVPALQALGDLQSEGAAVLRRLDSVAPHAREVRSGIEGWLKLAGRAVRREIAEHASVSLPRQVTTDPGGRAFRGPEEAMRVLAQHGRTFYFASRLMPSEVREPTARIYAFCRMVDDAVDGASEPREAERALRRIEAAARLGYKREGKGEDLVSRTMEEMRTAGISFQLVEELMEGVRMDLRPRRYEDLDDLRTYTHRVAGVVGLWIAGVAGVRDPWALELADELGHAMQLTNIARDVGADLGLGRIYLPTELLERHRLSGADLVRMAEGDGPISPAFAAALEELMGWADAGYGAAAQALPRLPAGYRRAMAVAARVYQGIHREIRRNGYDTLRRRAHTGTIRKGILGLGALRELGASERREAHWGGKEGPGAPPAG